MNGYVLASLILWIVSIFVTGVYFVAISMQYEEDDIRGVANQKDLKNALVAFISTLVFGWSYLSLLPLIFTGAIFWLIATIIFSLHFALKTVLYKNGKFVGIMSLWKKDQN